MDPLFILLGQWSFATLFAIALWHKLADWRSFEAAVADYRVMPRRISPALAILIVVFEATTVVALLWSAVPHGFGAAALLQLLYASGMALNLVRGRGYIACGCGTDNGRETISWLLVARNILLAIVAVALATSPTVQRPLTWLDWISAISALGAIVMLYAIFNVILSQFHRKVIAR